MDPEKRRELELEYWRECDTEYWDKLHIMPKWKILEVCYASLNAHPEIGFCRDGEEEMFDFRVEYLQRHFNVDDPNAYVDVEEAKRTLLELDKTHPLYLPKDWRPQEPTPQQAPSSKNQLSPAEHGAKGADKRHAPNRALKEAAIKIFDAKGGTTKFKSARQGARHILADCKKIIGFDSLSSSNAELTIAKWIREAYPSEYKRKKQ